MSYHLRRYENSRYWYVRVTRPDGTRTNWKSTRKTSKRDAEAVGRQWDSAASSGHRVVTLAEAYQFLAKHMQRKNDTASTMEVLTLKASHVCSAFGQQRDISTITLADTEAYLDHRRAQGRKDATISKELAYLTAALKRCKKLDLYDGNIEAIWPDALKKQFDGKERWLEPREYTALLETIMGKWRDHLIVYVSTGVRFAELYNLRAHHVRNGTVHVEGTKTKKKTKAGVRKVPLSVAANEVMQQRIQRSPDGILFPIESGGGGDTLKNQKRAWLRALGSACRRCKIPHVSTNDLRRTFASWCWHAGVDRDVLIRWMGHSSSKMVETVYAQPDEQQYKDEMTKFSARQLTPKSPEVETWN